MAESRTDPPPSTGQFHYFLKLPYDIRYQIYLLATPPRTVRLQEGFNIENEDWTDDYDEEIEAAFGEFRGKLVQGPLAFQIKLHPEIAHFSHNWRERIPFRARKSIQYALEYYGFTSTRSLKEPWHPTPETPRIPLDFLADFPELAFELSRESYFYSEAAIPVFLQVCSESRNALQRMGYQLAFATRSHQPRTWFHFGRDRLYLPRTRWDFSMWRDEGAPPTTYPPIKHGELLSGCVWDIGQISISDLKQVQNLVLGNSTMDEQPQFISEIVNLLPLMPDLKELCLEEWDAMSLVEWFCDADGTLSEERSRLYKGCMKNLSCISVEDVDVVGSVYWLFHGYDTSLNPVHSAGWHNSNWNKCKETDGGPFFEHTSSQIRLQLSQERRKLDVPLASNWRPPVMKFVHTCPDFYLQRFLSGRHDFWEFFTRYRWNLMADKNFKPSNPDAPTLKKPLNFNWHSLDWVREYRGKPWEELCKDVRALKAIDMFRDGYYGEPHHVGDHVLQMWYLNRFTISEPSMSIV